MFRNKVALWNKAPFCSCFVLKSDRLLAQTLSNQQVEAKIGCNALNRMTSFGMPATIRIG
jgi:hypothetical protein